MRRVLGTLFAFALVGQIETNELSFAANPAAFLPQGWDAETRERFYFTSQGSHLIPYDWYLALEQSDNHNLFRSDDNMRRLKFVVPTEKSKWNPDRLPVGFVKDTEASTAGYSIKRQSFGPKFDRTLYTEGKSWMGFTCAACHTSQIDCGNQTLQIDGAPSMADFESFLKELAAALDATHKNPVKFSRFEKRLDAKDRHKQLLKQVAEYSKVLNELVERNRADHPYGYARLDAFGAILNAVCSTALEIPSNRRISNAPVSYPFLWDTPHMDWVQWNSSAKVPIGRNVGEVLGVFGHFTIKPLQAEPRFSSTVLLKNLRWMEEDALAKLKAPAWPVAELGKLDPDRIQRGGVLFKRHCAKCHHERNDQGEFPMVEMPGLGKRIETTAILVTTIGTDPQMIKNLGHHVDPGDMKDLIPPPAITNGQVPRALLLKIAVEEITKVRAIAEMQMIPVVGDEPKAPLGGKGYKARPLNGIWATAPYFHNGSVPNLYETLLPSAMRSARFHVGSRQFDASRVGFDTAGGEGTSLFRVLDDQGQPIVGNSNKGHEGHDLTQTEENGTWRDFTDAERWDLVEYMKSLQ